jgi:GNAT superfamily N-acetyltransferase
MAAFEINTEQLLNLTPVYPLKKPLAATLLDDAEFGPAEFEELCWHYLHNFPSAISLGKIKTRWIDEKDEAEPRAEGAGGGPRMEFDSRLYMNGEMIGQLMLSLYRRPTGEANEVFLELEQAQIWEPELRGRGLGKAIVENVLTLGRTLGVKAVTLFAMYDGRFVWPALGFRFGDYAPDPKRATKYRKAFRAFCRRHGITPPDTRGWDAPDFARFISEKQATAMLGYRRERDRRRQVEMGRAFLQSRYPFFLCYPLD